MKSEE